MTRPIRVLVVDGNTRADRQKHLDGWGMTPSDSYAAAVKSIDGSVLADVALPADEGANLPDPAGLDGYDGVFLTGSALHIYRIEPAVTRQIELMRSVYRSGVPAFGSCWGIQVGAVAAGGTVTPNPAGREIGIARRIARTPAGEAHPLLEGRPASFDAPAIHLDLVAAPPAEAVVLAANGMTPMQAAEFRHEGGLFWGVQYHPEFSLPEVAAILRRRKALLIDEGFRRSEVEADAYCDDLVALGTDPTRRDLAWAHGLDEQVLDPMLRLTEIRNFLKHRVRPQMSARGRA